MTTIPVKELVEVDPSVLGVGGTALDATGLFLTTSTRIPIGTVPSFADPDSVASFFGAGSNEAAEAAVYFAGFTIANKLPAELLMAQYNQSAVAAYLRGGAFGLTLAQAQALSGSLTVIMDGYSHVISSISFSAQNSFSAMAAAIQAAFTDPTEASFTAAIGATLTASMGGHFGTCTSTGTTLTLGSVTDGYLSAGDFVSGTDSTNSLPAGCYIVKQLTGTPGGSAGATFQLSAAATPGNLTSCTVTGTSSIIDATAVTGLISIGDTITGTTVPSSTTVASQLTGTTGGIGTYQLSCAAQGIASEAMVAHSTVLNVTVDTDHAIAVGQTLVGSGVTGTPLITAQIAGTPGGVGTYSISGAQQEVASESMTAAATAPVVTYDSVSAAFVITSGITGTPSTAAFATGTLAASLNLTSATGAVLSQGAPAAVPATFMNALIQVTTDWVTFTTLFDPDNGSGNTVKLAFAAWKNTQNNRYGYVCWDTDITSTEAVPATGSLGYLLPQAGDSGTCLIYEPSNLHLASFICGAAAAIDFTETNGRITFAYKSQAGLVASVTNATVALNLAGNPQASDRGNGYNFYGAYGPASEPFIWFQRGFCTGPFSWFDSYINQIVMNRAFQSALLTLQQNSMSIPYTVSGDALIESALADPIATFLNFGAFAPGAISQSQITAVNNAAGANIAGSLQSQGYYLQVLPASSTSRAARTTPPCKFWYLDRGSVQAITLGSVALQ